MPPKYKFSWRKIVLLFVVTYPVWLLLWLPAKDYYAAGIAYCGAEFTPMFQKVSFESLEMKHDQIAMKFGFNLPGNRINSASVMINTSTYAFSVPLILALLSAFVPFLEKKKGPVLTIVAAVLGIHFLHVFLDQNYAIAMAFTSAGYMTGGEVWIFCRRYLSEWMEFLVLRFLPFLCGFYLLANLSFFREWIKNSSPDKNPRRPKKFTKGE
jgi:hypothetical protein